MKGLTPRYLRPIDLARPRGARLLEAFSPKLERAVRFFDSAAFDFWIGLEADPKVTGFCERPVRSEGDFATIPIDFWVRRVARDHEEMIVLERDGEVEGVVPAVVDGLPVRLVREAEQAASAVWIENWQRMLSPIIATRDLRPGGLTRSVLRFVSQPRAFSAIERELVVDDPSLVRATCFELLRTGELFAPSLRTQFLSPLTILEPAR